MELVEDRQIRYAALDLAVQTVRNMSGFSDAQVIRTAQKYEQYISAGAVPPIMAPAQPDPRGDT